MTNEKREGFVKGIGDELGIIRQMKGSLTWESKIKEEERESYRVECGKKKMKSWHNGQNKVKEKLKLWKVT